METSLMEWNRGEEGTAAFCRLLSSDVILFYARNFTTVLSLPKTTNQPRIPSRRLLSISSRTYHGYRNIRMDH